MNIPNKPTFRIDEVKKIFQVTDKTVRNWIAEGRLEAYKVGGCVRIKRESILKCMIKIIPGRGVG